MSALLHDACDTIDVSGSGATRVRASSVFAVVCLGAMINAVLPSLLEQSHAVGLTLAGNPDLGVSKIVFACILAGLFRVVRDLKDPLRPIHVLCFLPALLGTLAVSGTAAWLGLSISAALLMASSPDAERVRGGLVIIVLGAFHAPGTEILGQVAGGTVLGIDRWVAASLLSLFAATETFAGNAIQASGGELILLVWECGVLKNIALVLLFWFTVLELLARPGPRARATDAVLLVAFCVAANATRLTLMALREDWFEYFHDGQGALVLRLLLLAAPLVLAGARISHARA